MDKLRVLAIILIVAGILSLVYGGFTYTSQTHRADIGPIELAIKEKNTITIPIWVGIGAIVVGGAMLVIKKRGLSG